MVNALTVRDLTVTRGGVAVLSGLSFCVAAGQALVLRGPNGVGKTTVLRTIAGLQLPATGQVICPVDRAYAAHADGLKPALTVWENLMFWARLHGDMPVEPALMRMDLRGLADRPAANLSAGQKRRLGLARLLVTGAALWVMDEPTVSLDAAGVALFGQVLAEHLGAGGAALIATHVDLGVAVAELDLTAYKAPQIDDFDMAFG
ncbi:MAG TPA: heme ABC exporter ATP-binding protein CcmA [Paenirhodobacter sp.]